MTAEFVDTNVLIYAADADTGPRHTVAVDLIARLAEEGSGAISTQVLIEFYSAATRKLRMPSVEAEAIIRDLSAWSLHRPTHADVIAAIHLQRRHKLAWWDAMILNSAKESGASILWSEDLQDGRKFGSMVVRNPFGQLRNELL